jgi:uncharacterized protein (TIGR02266 family)
MRILVADDDIVFLELVQDVLTKAGYKVGVATNGRRALELALQMRPNLIVLDVILPGLRGTEISQELRKYSETSSVPILLVSAKVDALDETGGDPAGFQADDFLPKPFSPDQFLQRVNTLTGLRSGSTEVARPGPAPGSERRRFPRLPLHVKITAKTIELLMHHPMINISSGGVYVEVDRSIETGTELDLRFSVPGRPGEVQTKGKVAWCMELEGGGQYGLGIRFSDLAEGDLDKVQGYVKSVSEVVRANGAGGAHTGRFKKDS